MIPLADNVLGLGKSAFGDHYIQRCRETYQGKQDEFNRTLCASHTISIVLGKEDLITDDFNCKMNKLIVNALLNRFKTPPSVLSKIPTTTSSFLTRLVHEVGPLFIALDEIGRAFEGDRLNDTERRNWFFRFCSHILGSWHCIKGVYFLLLGRASFLNCIAGSENVVPVPSRSYVFSGTNVHLLRLPAGHRQ